MTAIKDLSVALSLVASVVLGWIWLDNRHAKEQAVQVDILELRQEG